VKNLTRFACFCLVLISLLATPVLRGQTVASDLTPFDIGSANVCPPFTAEPAPCSTTAAIHFKITEGGVLGTPNVLTMGTPNLDFKLTGDTCTGNVTAGSLCTVKVTMTPKFPGLREGVVQITDVSGNVLAFRLLHGIGLGPQVAIDNGLVVTLGGTPHALAITAGVVVDSAGDVFFSSQLPAAVYELPTGGGPLRTVGAGFGDPQGLALDGAGNLYVTDEGTGLVVKVPPGCESTSCQTTLDGGFYRPEGIAVDFAGNVYVVDVWYLRVVELPVGCVSPSCAVQIGKGLNFPYAIAVDSAGNIFVSDISVRTVVKIAAGSGAMTTVLRNINSYGMAVDAAGDLFLSDPFNDQIVEAAAGASTLTTVARAPTETWAVALDAAGNVYFTTTGNNTAASEIQRVQIPTYTFATAPVGTLSSDSPQSFTVQNSGNTALFLRGLKANEDLSFNQVTGSGTPQDCKGDLSLAPGASCNLSISFTPAYPGPIVTAAVLQDDGGNSASATQMIPLQGIGGSIGPSIGFFDGFSYPGGDTNINLGLATNGGAAIGNDVLQLTDGGLNESRSAFDTTPVGLAFFQTSFDFQLTGTNTPAPDADGIAFVLEGNGPDALGTSGGGLGYGLPAVGQPGAKITNSVAVKFDLHNNDGEGSSSTGLYIDGAAPTVPATNLLPSGIDLHSGHVFHVVLVYTGGLLELSITDRATNASFTQDFPIDLSAVIGGSTAFAGFTAGTGAKTAVQNILNWQLTSSACCQDGMPVFSSGFPIGSNLTLNGSAAISDGVLNLTQQTPNQASSAYFDTVIPVSKFTSDFDFQLSRGDGEGFTFVLQSEGLNAIGPAGGGLGYGPSTPDGPGSRIFHSLAVKFDLYSDAGEGSNSTGVYVGGDSPTVPATNLLPSAINLHSGHAFHARLNYDGANLTVSITDLTEYAVYTGVYAVDIPAAVGGTTAFAGFTAATGAEYDTVNILDWTMTSY
jgi:sugar lactone lactonase YvrE